MERFAANKEWFGMVCCGGVCEYEAREDKLKMKKNSDTKVIERSVLISPPKFQEAIFHIVGTEVMVIRRFSTKTKKALGDKAIAGKTASSRKVREPQDPEAIYNEARYISDEGWDGFPCSAIRCAMINACRLVDYKMVLAKMSIFVVADGHDAKEPQIPLIRIIGDPILQEDVARVQTGQPYITVRPAYHNWSADIKIRWDADQFTLDDVTNLLARAGGQVGIMEGRPFSKDSAGLGWGTFEIEHTEEKAA